MGRDEAEALLLEVEAILVRRYQRVDPEIEVYIGLYRFQWGVSAYLNIASYDTY